MKTVLIFFSLLVVISSCSSDPMGLKRPVNQQLDSLIADKINKIKADTLSLKKLNLHVADITKIDSTIKSFWIPINLYDACTDNSEKADEYFKRWALKLEPGTTHFIKITDLDVKSKIILGIKKNEIALLDQLLLRRE